MKKYLLILLLTSGIFQSCKSGYNYQSSAKPFYTPGKAGIIAVDSSVASEIYPYKVKVDSIMSEVLAYSAEPLEKGQPESKLGNFVADLCLKSINDMISGSGGVPADFCVLNNGGLRSSLPAGPITLKNVYELMPFENELVVLELDGNTVGKLLQYISGKGGVPVSNLKMKIKDNAATHVLINGNVFDPNKKYRLVTSDYLAMGSDGMNMLSESLSSQPSGLKVRDAIARYLRMEKLQGDTIKVVTDGRISK